MRRDRTCAVCRRTFSTEALFDEHSCGTLGCPACGKEVTVLVKVLAAWCPCGARLAPVESRDETPGRRGVEIAETASEASNVEALVPFPLFRDAPRETATGVP